jgi:hypothetical protein
MPNFLMNALGRPQIGHLEYALLLNRGLRSALIIKDFFAKHASFTISGKAFPLTEAMLRLPHRWGLWSQ